MGNKVYFANCVKDIISVTLNNSIRTRKLKKRTAWNSEETAGNVNLPATWYEIRANKDKDIFGTGQNVINSVQINFKVLQSHSDFYKIETTNLSGQNLYFYIYQDTIIGQNETGSTEGIKISVQQLTRIKLQ
jgi:hypothetical protein